MKESFLSRNRQGSGLRGRLGVGVGVTALVVSGAGIAFASIPSSGNGTIYSCYNKNSGALRVINKDAGLTCANHETLLQWNQQGVPGPVGPKGDTGATGAVGPVGATGLTGPAGPIGLTGAKGEQGLPGDIGPVGLTGPKGDPGLPGEVGAVGPAGAKGDKGEQGLPGVSGRQVISSDAGPFPTGSFGAVEAVCPAGKVAISGGYVLSGNWESAHVLIDAPSPGGWLVEVYNSGSNPVSVTAWAVCVTTQ